MAEEEKGLTFDFENSLVLPVGPTKKPSPESDIAGAGNSKSYRTLVCRHWLRSLCIKGDSCLFLHQFDKSRMPICQNFRLSGKCQEKDCVMKHSFDDTDECNMYKMGFCPNGPDCRFRHVKRPGPPPPVEEVLLKIQQLASNNYGNSNRMETSYGHQEAQQVQIQNFPYDQNEASMIATPLPQGTSRYFVVKSCNRENLELSVQQGVWATQRINEARLNEAFESVNNVILIFSVNKTGHFQGCAKMTTKIGGYVGGGNWNGTALYGTNFALKWLKLCELPFYKTQHLRNPFNENKPVKISRDCQELESSVGEQLALLLYLEPDSKLMAISIAAESKREEDKDLVNKDDNPDIVLFEDNEEEEEENEEEDVSLRQSQGRGIGLGLMWPCPHLPVARGIRPFPSMPGFPPNIMGPVGFPGFPMPDPVALGPRGFGPYGPRFPSGFPRPGPGLMFPARPPGGYGMMIGPGQAPFMARMGPGPARASHPAGRPPFNSPTQLNPPQSRVTEVQRTVNTTSRVEGAYQTGKGQIVDRNNRGTGSIYRNDESESEDEAPRRSRHGERKKKRSLKECYESGDEGM